MQFRKGRRVREERKGEEAGGGGRRREKERGRGRGGGGKERERERISQDTMNRQKF